MTTKPEAVNAMPAQPISSTTRPAAMSGSSLAVTTGIAAGVILLATATAGFHDLAATRAARLPGPASLGAEG
jgi:hypothetical protein